MLFVHLRTWMDFYIFLQLEVIWIGSVQVLEHTEACFQDVKSQHIVSKPQGRYNMSLEPFSTIHRQHV